MSKYSDAEIAARDAVIQALYDNIKQDKLSELWNHYLGLRSVAETLPKEESKIFLTENEGDGKMDNISFEGITLGDNYTIPVPGGLNDTDFRVDDNGYVAGDSVNDVVFTPSDNLSDVITFSSDPNLTNNVPFTYGFDSSDTIVFGGDTEKKEDEETT